jgi:hypothetical protein
MIEVNVRVEDQLDVGDIEPELPDILQDQRAELGSPPSMSTWPPDEVIRIEVSHRVPT